MRNYALMMLIGDVDAFEGYVYTWTPWTKDLEDWLIHNEFATDAESVELALFAMPEGYTLDEDVSGALIIYDPSGYQANVVTSKNGAIYATEYPNSHKYFNKIVTIWKREDGKKVYNEKITKIHGRLSDAAISQIHVAIAYDLGDDAANAMLESDKRIKAYYLENVKLIAADDAAAGIIQDAVLVHRFGDCFGIRDCILAGCTKDDFETDNEVTNALKNCRPINNWWEDGAGIMHEEIPEEMTDEELEIRPDDDEEA